MLILTRSFWPEHIAIRTSCTIRVSDFFQRRCVFRSFSSTPSVAANERPHGRKFCQSTKRSAERSSTEQRNVCHSLIHWPDIRVRAYAVGAGRLRRVDRAHAVGCAVRRARSRGGGEGAAADVAEIVAARTVATILTGVARVPGRPSRTFLRHFRVEGLGGTTRSLRRQRWREADK